MLPLFLSVEVLGTGDQKNELAHVRRNYSRRNTFQFPLHCFSLGIFTHELAESGVVDI